MASGALPVPGELQSIQELSKWLGASVVELASERLAAENHTRLQCIAMKLGSHLVRYTGMHLERPLLVP